MTAARQGEQQDREQCSPDTYSITSPTCVRDSSTSSACTMLRWPSPRSARILISRCSTQSLDSRLPSADSTQHPHSTQGTVRLIAPSQSVKNTQHATRLGRVVLQNVQNGGQAGIFTQPAHLHGPLHRLPNYSRCDHLQQMRRILHWILLPAACGASTAPCCRSSCWCSKSAAAAALHAQEPHTTTHTWMI